MRPSRGRAVKPRPGVFQECRDERQEFRGSHVPRRHREELAEVRDRLFFVLGDQEGEPEDSPNDWKLFTPCDCTHSLNRRVDCTIDSEFAATSAGF